MQTRKISLWLLAALVLAATATRLYQIDSQSIWFDEGWSAFAAVQPSLQTAVESDPTNPPLYYILLNLSVNFTGDSPLALRLFSLVLGVLTIPLTYRLARRLFDERAGLYAAFLAAFSPLLWWASQEARMYTLLAVVVLLTTMGWHQLLREPKRWAWLVLWAGELALLYAHNTGPVIVIWLNLVTLLAWAVQRSLKRPYWRTWVAWQIGVAVLWSPWFVARFLQIQAANSAVNTPPELSLTLLDSMWQALWAGNWLMVGREPLVVGFSAVAFVLAVLLIPWRRSEARWLVLHVTILAAGLLIGLAAIGNQMHGRYLVMAVPILLTALGAGLSRLPFQILRLPVTIFFFAIFTASVHFATQTPAYAHDDARRMVQYYADNLTAADSVIAWSYADRYDLFYYWNRLGVQARRVTLPEGADLEAILPLLPTRGDVALNVWYTQRADYRGMMTCLLSHGTVIEPEIFTVQGMTDYLYRSPVLNLPQQNDFDGVFTDNGVPIVQVTTIGSFPAFTAEQALCLPIRITLLQDIDVDLKATLIAYNDLGWEIARTDAVFAQADQRTSSQLDLGSLLTAYPLLRLPYGAPAADYEVRLRIYDEVEKTSGYDVLAEAGTPAGKDLRLETWAVLSGSAWANRSTDLPVVVSLAVGEHLTLTAHNVIQTGIVNGTSLDWSFLWEGTDPLPDMALVGDDWRVDMPPGSESEHNVITLDWREVRVPPDIEAGRAELQLSDGTVVAEFAVEVIPAQYTAPSVEVSVDVSLLGVGRLVGFSLEAETIDRRQPLTVTLVWQADATPETSYTVFVQLLSAEGRVIAQSDSIPAQGGRATTGWRRGEYIVDAHELAFHDGAAPGTATLIAGMYDAATGQRVQLPSGGDAIILAEDLMVR
jgi:uncharacterized membrane protein